jgi:acetolactate synthase-1/2/3 large subunit
VLGPAWLKGPAIIKLSDYVMQFVVSQGVPHLFMLPGGGCMHLADSAGHTPGLEYIACLHEQACAFAAQAYSQYTNHLGVALVTTGPGGTNALTGVAGAWTESDAVLVISGQVKRADLLASSGVRTMGQQELDIVSIVKPITKYAVTVTEPESIRYHLEKAVYLATHGRRGPVWIDIPLDVQAIAIDEDQLEGFSPTELPASDLLDAAQMQERAQQAVKTLAAAERPVLFMGNGVRAARAAREALQLAEALQLPILVTWKALDLVPEDHPLYIGRPGAIGQRAANFAQQNAEAMLILGARLDLPQTAFNHENFAPHARKFVVDVDPAEIRKLRMVDMVGVPADAGDFLRACLSALPVVSSGEHEPWLERCRDWVRRYPVVLPEYWDNPSGPVNTYTLVETLAELANPEDLIVPGSSGPASDHVMQAWRVKPGQRVLNAPGLGAMGTGIPGTLGACVASNRRRTLCLNGDGGFQLNIQELETIHRLNLPIKFFVLDNGGYGSIMAMQRGYFAGRYVASESASGLTFPDLEKVAQAYQLATDRIETQGEMPEGVRRVLERPGPVVCVVRVDPLQPTAPRVTSSLRDDGMVVSNPMEDMAPFLDREEFRSNMLGTSAFDEGRP